MQKLIDRDNSGQSTSEEINLHQLNHAVSLINEEARNNPVSQEEFLTLFVELHSAPAVAPSLEDMQ